MKVPALVVVPFVLVAIVGVGLYPSTPCACAHPFAVLVGPLQPLNLTDDAIRKRIQAWLPVGSSRAQAQDAFRGRLGDTYEKYCKEAVKSIVCEAMLEQDLFGMRSKGLTVTIRTDASDRVAALEVSRFSRWE